MLAVISEFLVLHADPAGAVAAHDPGTEIADGRREGQALALKEVISSKRVERRAYTSKSGKGSAARASKARNRTVRMELRQCQLIFS